MAFVSEVTAKLGLDTSEFQKKLTQTVANVGDAGVDVGKKLRRSFGAGDVFKGLLQGIGIGSVGQISDAIVRPFQIASDRARELVGFTGRLRDITQKEIGASGGPKAEMKMMEQHVADINEELSIQQKLVDDLNSNPLKWVNSATMDMLLEAERELNNLKVEQAEILSTIKTTKMLQKRAVDDTIRAVNAESKLTDIEIRDGSEREKLLIRLNALRLEGEKIAQRGLSNTEKGNQQFREWMSALGQLKKLRADALREIEKGTVGIGGAAQSGHSKTRGRTETERLADQAARYKFQSEEDILKADPIGAAANAKRAFSAYSKAGKRSIQASSMIDKNVADALQSNLISASESLRKASDNLKPVPVAGVN